MKHFFTVAAFAFGITFASAQAPCFEIEYLDFFDLNDQDTMWSDDDLQDIRQMDLVNQTHHTHYLVPPLVAQLRQFHPDCAGIVSSDRYNVLMNLYFTIRQQDRSILEGRNMAQQIEYIRDDFYFQVLNDTLLGHMVFGEGQGPIYGEVCAETIDLSRAIILETVQGRVYIVNHGFRRVVAMVDAAGMILWSRIMTDAFGKHLTDLSFAPGDYIVTSRGIKVNMLSNEETITMYIDLNGAFMFYFHSM